MLDVTLLGTGGMMPLPNRYLTSAILRYNGRMLLIDCGEGTQVTNKINGWGFKNIDTICFTHVHGDHITGLPGMLLTIGNSGREEGLTIIGPYGIAHVVRSLMVICKDLPFEIRFIELPQKKCNIVVGDFNINTLGMDHRIQCLGYSVEIKRVGKFSREKATKLGIPVNLWSLLQRKENVSANGQEFTPEMVLGEDRSSIKMCYMTDTRPVLEAAEFVKNANLFIGEGIYGDDEKNEKAIKHKHMTYQEVAKIAKDGEVDELWLTHFSPALVEPEEYLNYATDIFENTKIGTDRMTTTLYFDK